jgi:SRSO17 transposase
MRGSRANIAEGGIASSSGGDRKDHAGLTHAWRNMEAEVPDGWQAWVVVRRSLSDPTEVVYDRVCAPKQTTLHQIVAVAGQRWKVEEAIERAKGACGLDQYEVRSWTGWYRHITLSLLAQLSATLMMDLANAEQGKKAWEPKPGPSSLQHFTSQRGLAVG